MWTANRASLSVLGNRACPSWAFAFCYTCRSCLLKCEQTMHVQYAVPQRYAYHRSLLARSCTAAGCRGTNGLARLPHSRLIARKAQRGYAALAASAVGVAPLWYSKVGSLKRRQSEARQRSIVHCHIQGRPTAMSAGIARDRGEWTGSRERAHGPCQLPVPPSFQQPRAFDIRPRLWPGVRPLEKSLVLKPFLQWRRTTLESLLLVVSRCVEAWKQHDAARLLPLEKHPTPNSFEFGSCRHAICLCPRIRVRTNDWPSSLQ